MICNDSIKYFIVTAQPLQKQLRISRIKMHMASAYRDALHGAAVFASILEVAGNIDPFSLPA
jgi:hypothetical protein